MIRLYLLGITTKHWVDQFDAMGQTGRDNIAGSGSQKRIQFELIRSSAQMEYINMKISSLFHLKR